MLTDSELATDDQRRVMVTPEPDESVCRKSDRPNNRSTAPGTVLKLAIAPSALEIWLER